MLALVVVVDIDTAVGCTARVLLLPTTSYRKNNQRTKKGEREPKRNQENEEKGNHLLAPIIFYDQTLVRLPVAPRLAAACSPSLFVIQKSSRFFYYLFLLLSCVFVFFV